jgi:hypothetical protein
MTARIRASIEAAHRPALAMLVAFLALAAVPAARAQGPIALGIGGGVTVPRDRLETTTERGYHGLLTLRLGVPLIPVHARLDAMHARFGAGPLSEDGRFDVSAVSANLGYDVVPLAVASVYVVAGAGYYWTSWEATGAERLRRAGWNAGLGVRLSLGGTQLFGEARYHSIRADGGEVHVVPLTVGLFF